MKWVRRRISNAEHGVVTALRASFDNLNREADDEMKRLIALLDEFEGVATQEGSNVPD